jgi:hypothetical protein
MMFAQPHRNRNQPGTRLARTALCCFALLPQAGLVSAASPTTACLAVLSLVYEQRNTMAQVEGTIENTTCAASSGDYALGITVKDAKDELQTLEFSEKWQRSDNKTITFKDTYPIGENVDLRRITPRKVHCVCTVAPE